VEKNYVNTYFSTQLPHTLFDFDLINNFVLACDKNSCIAYLELSIYMVLKIPCSPGAGLFLQFGITL
jgi:hypothetical protein